MIDFTLEANVLSGMLNYEECLIDGLADIKDEDFYDSTHQKMFQTMRYMYENGAEVNEVSLAREARDLINQNTTRVVFMVDTFVSPGNFKFYVDKLKDQTKARKIVELSEQLIQRLQDKDDTKSVLYDAENVIYQIAAESEEAEIYTPAQHAERMLETLTERMEKKTNGGIKTSYAKLNEAINGGFQPGELIILAAQTGHGKTAFAMNITRDVAITQKCVVLYVNTEMNPQQLDNRWMTMLTPDVEITHSKIATGDLTQDQLNKIVASMDWMYRSGFHSVTVHDLTINKLISIARKFKAQKQIKMLFVDYVGRMDTSDTKLAEYQVLKNIAKRLKTLAQELEMTIIMLAQITESEKLEGAKGMKNECDLYAYLRPLSDSERLDCQQTFNYALIIDKNRNGKKGKIKLNFIGEKLTFIDREMKRSGLVEVQQEPDGNNRADGTKGGIGTGGGNRQKHNNRKS